MWSIENYMVRKKLELLTVQFKVVQALSRFYTSTSNGIFTSLSGKMFRISKIINLLGKM